MASDDDGRPIPEAVEAYRKADRLDPFGFSGWIGREPHGALQVRLRHGPRRRLRRAGGRAVRRAGQARRRRPVAGGRLVRQPPRHRLRRLGSRSSCSGSARPTTRCPTSPRRHPRATPSPAARPARRQFKALWPQMIADSATDLAYRRLYYYLHKVVDQAIGRILEALALGDGRRHDRRVHLGSR